MNESFARAALFPSAAGATLGAARDRGRACASTTRFERWPRASTRFASGALCAALQCAGGRLAADPLGRERSGDALRQGHQRGQRVRGSQRVRREPRGDGHGHEQRWSARPEQVPARDDGHGRHRRPADQREDDRGRRWRRASTLVSSLRRRADGRGARARVAQRSSSRRAVDQLRDRTLGSVGQGTAARSSRARPATDRRSSRRHMPLPRHGKHRRKVQRQQDQNASRALSRRRDREQRGAGGADAAAGGVRSVSRGALRASARSDADRGLRGEWWR